MWKMIVKRFLILIPQLLAITIITFILGSIMPGDALSGRIDPSLSREAMEQQRIALGLDDPLPVRYVNWLRAIIFEGDFGQSFTHRRPVTDIIAERVNNTFWLSTSMLLMSYVIALPLGVIAGRFAGKLTDKAILLYIFVALSLPTLVLAILMILFFAHELGWFPSSGSVSALVLSTGTMGEILLNRLHHMVLPVMTGAILAVVGTVFMLRANIIDRTYSDYVTMARSKGVPTGIIFRRHILRNSLVPVTASFGPAVASVLTGTVFIERIFQYPGMGDLFLSSIVQRDFAVTNTMIIIFSVLTALGMLISDILLPLVDPRIRIQ